MDAIFLQSAGIAARVEINSSNLLDNLQTRYQGFMVPNASPAFPVLIQLDHEARAVTHLSPAFTFDETRVFFDLPGYTGFIDPDRAAGLRIASDQAPAGVDYFLRVVFALLVHGRGGLMVHAAGIVRRGRAYLFFGPSGAGKTTVARNSPSDVVLNDDLVALMPAGPGWQAHGTPFTNRSQAPPTPADAPAAALLRLVQSPRVFLEPLQGAPAMAELLASAPVVNAAPSPPFDRCQQILRTVPAYHLHLLPDASFWPLVEEIEGTPGGGC